VAWQSWNSKNEMEEEKKLIKGGILTGAAFSLGQ